MKFSQIKKIPTIAFIIGGGVVIFYCWVAAFALHYKQAELYGYLFLSYAGAVMAYIGIKGKKETGPIGWKYRFIGFGILLSIISAVQVFKYFLLSVV